VAGDPMPSFAPGQFAREASQPREITRLNFEEALSLIEIAENLDYIEQALLGYALSKVNRVLLLRISRSAAHGWNAAGEGPSLEEVRKINVPLSERGTLKLITESRMPHVGALAGGVSDEAFEEQLGRHLTGGAALLPVLLNKQVVYILCLDTGDDKHMTDLSDLLVLTQACSAQLGRMSRKTPVAS
jgi:hypothetical protein